MNRRSTGPKEVVPLLLEHEPPIAVIEWEGGKAQAITHRSSFVIPRSIFDGLVAGAGVDICAHFLTMGEAEQIATALLAALGAGGQASKL